MSKYWLVICIAIFAVSCGAQDAEKDTASRVDFNSYVTAVLKSYPCNGTHQYYWPSSGGWAGNTQDMYYRSDLFAQGDSFKRCYCCGITFEVFFFAYKKYCRERGKLFIINSFDGTALRKFRGQWFGSDGNRKTLLNAIVSNGMGRAVSFEEARQGDFVQLWRHNGSGHSVIFIDWAKSNGQIIGMKYWSTQGSTNGIGYRTEYFGGSSGLDSSQTYIARVEISTK